MYLVLSFILGTIFGFFTLSLLTVPRLHEEFENGFRAGVESVNNAKSK